MWSHDSLPVGANNTEPHKNITKAANSLADRLLFVVISLTIIWQENPSRRKYMYSAGRNRFFIIATSSKGINYETSPTEQVTSFDSLHGVSCTFNWWLDFSGWSGGFSGYIPFVRTLEVWNCTQHIHSTRMGPTRPRFMLFLLRVMKKQLRSYLWRTEMF